jgi:hypothetical protein
MAIEPHHPAEASLLAARLDRHLRSSAASGAS